MKLTKKFQYGLLICLYLSRAGKATVATMSENLKLKHPFLCAVANKLKQAGILTAVKGPHGGYQLSKDVMVAEIYLGLNEPKMITQSDMNFLNRSGCEGRATADLLISLVDCVSEPMACTVSQLNTMLAKKEIQIMDAMDVTKEVN